MSDPLPDPRGDPLFLYSTNTRLKLLIQGQYLGYHHVWCSPVFGQPRAIAGGEFRVMAPSASPASIYRRLQEDIAGKDKHSEKIQSQKATLIRLAAEWHSKGDITEDQMNEILYLVNEASFDDWRPVLVVIRHDLVKQRVQTVPMNDRAGMNEEFILPDLRHDEFDQVEF